MWNVSVVGSTAFQQEENALVPTDRGPPETRYGAFIKKDTSKFMSELKMSLLLLLMLMMKQVLWGLTSEQKQLALSQGFVWIQVFSFLKII